MDHVNFNDVVLRKSSVGSEEYYVRIANPLMHPGAMHANMPQEYTLLDGRVIERVPRPPPYSPPNESTPAITFAVNGWAGVRVKDILKNRVVVDAPNDTIFHQYGWRGTVINFEWPGYEKKSWYDPMCSRINVCPDGQHLTRQSLATEICYMLFHFHKVVSGHPIACGQEKWALTTRGKGIRVPDIVLLSLHYYRNVWVPELYVIREG